MAEKNHLVCNSYVENSLSLSFKYNETLKAEIFCLNDDLRIGPLDRLNEREGLQRREEWMKLTDDEMLFHSWMEKGFKDGAIIKQVKEALSQGRQLYVWYGNNAYDLLSISRLMFETKPAPEQVFLIPVSEFMQTKLSGDEFFPQSMGVLRIEQIANLGEFSRQAKSEEIAGFIKIWEEISTKTQSLKVMSDNGEIVCKPETFFDEILISLSTAEFKKAALVIGSALVRSKFEASDDTLNWRLKELVKQNKLKARGSLHHIRDYEVRLI